MPVLFITGGVDLSRYNRLPGILFQQHISAGKQRRIRRIRWLADLEVRLALLGLLGRRRYKNWC